MRAFLLAVIFALSGCSTTERQTSIQENSLAKLVAAFPLGMSAESVLAVSLDRGWEVRADQQLARWPLHPDGPTVDRVFTLMLPKRAGIPFSYSVFAYVGAKSGKVVGHRVAVDLNAL